MSIPLLPVPEIDAYLQSLVGGGWREWARVK